jgi:hypothetical protein
MTYRVIQGYSLGVFTHTFLDQETGSMIEEKCIIFGLLDKQSIYQKGCIEKSRGMGGFSILDKIIVIRNGLSNPCFNYITSPFFYFQLKIHNTVIRNSYTVSDKGKISKKKKETKLLNNNETNNNDESDNNSDDDQNDCDSDINEHGDDNNNINDIVYDNTVNPSTPFEKNIEPYNEDNYNKGEEESLSLDLSIDSSLHTSKKRKRNDSDRKHKMKRLKRNNDANISSDELDNEDNELDNLLTNDDFGNKNGDEYTDHNNNKECTATNGIETNNCNILNNNEVYAQTIDQIYDNNDVELDEFDIDDIMDNINDCDDHLEANNLPTIDDNDLEELSDNETQTRPQPEVIKPISSHEPPQIDFYSSIGEFIQCCTLISVISAEYTPPKNVRDMVNALAVGFHFRPYILEFLKLSDPLTGKNELKEFVGDIIAKKKSPSVNDVNKKAMTKTKKGYQETEKVKFGFKVSQTVNGPSISGRSSFGRRDVDAIINPNQKFFTLARQNYDNNMVRLLNVDMNIKQQEQQPLLQDCYSINDSLMQQIAFIYAVGLKRIHKPKIKSTNFIDFLSFADDRPGGSSRGLNAFGSMMHNYVYDISIFIKDPLVFNEVFTLLTITTNCSDHPDNYNINGGSTQDTMKIVRSAIDIASIPCSLFNSYTRHHFIQIFHFIERNLLENKIDNIESKQKALLNETETLIKTANTPEDIKKIDEDVQERFAQLNMDKIRAIMDFSNDMKPRIKDSFAKYILMSYVKKLIISIKNGEGASIYISPTSLYYSFSITPERGMRVHIKDNTKVNAKNNALKLFSVRSKNVSHFFSHYEIGNLTYLQAIKIMVDAYVRSYKVNIDYNDVDYFFDYPTVGNSFLKDFVLLYMLSNDGSYKIVTEDEVQHISAAIDNTQNQIVANETTQTKKNRYLTIYPRLVLCHKSAIMKAQCLSAIWNRKILSVTNIIPINNSESLSIYSKQKGDDKTGFFDAKFCDYISKLLIEKTIDRSRVLYNTSVILVRNESRKNELVELYKSKIDSYAGEIKIICYTDIFSLVRDTHNGTSDLCKLLYDVYELHTTPKNERESKELQQKLKIKVYHLINNLPDTMEYNSESKVMLHIDLIHEFTIDELMSLCLCFCMKSESKDRLQLFLEGKYRLFEWIEGIDITVHTLMNCLNETDDRLLPFIFENKKVSQVLLPMPKKLDKISEYQPSDQLDISRDEDDFFRLALENEGVIANDTFNDISVNPFIGYDERDLDHDFNSVDIEWGDSSIKQLIDYSISRIKLARNVDELSQLIEENNANNTEAHPIINNNLLGSNSLFALILAEQQNITNLYSGRSVVGTDSSFRNCSFVSLTHSFSKWVETETGKLNMKAEDMRLLSKYFEDMKTSSNYNIRTKPGCDSLVNDIKRKKVDCIIIDAPYWMRFGNVYDIVRLLHITSVFPKIPLYLVYPLLKNNDTSQRVTNEWKIREFIIACKKVKPSLVKNLCFQ